MRNSEIALFGALGLLLFIGLANYLLSPIVLAGDISERLALKTGADAQLLKPEIMDVLREAGDRRALFFSLMACGISALNVWIIASRRWK